MVEKDEFWQILRNLSSKTILERANSISNDCIQIIEINKEVGLINALVQGNGIIPYNLNINISESSLYDIIHHDCPDYLARKKMSNKFCKHIVKFFSILNHQDSELATSILNKIYSKINMQPQKKDTDLFDLNHFINETINSQLDFDYKGFEFFFNLLELEDSARECIKEILIEAKKLPAALGGFHGAYEGGLFDHILLVTNYAYRLNNSAKYDLDMKKTVLTAIYHDFGKISYYSSKKEEIIPKIQVEREELDKVNEEIIAKFNYAGRDYHIEEGLAVLKKYKDVLFLDDEMFNAIIFHHGQWSKYYPINMNELATLIHEADMIASHTHFI